MVLKPIVYIRIVISLSYKLISQKPDEIPTFKTVFIKIFSFGLYFAENRHFQVRSGLLRHVIVTSYVDRLVRFWYQWQEKTLPYTMVPNNYTLVVLSLIQQGVVTTPLKKTCYRKRPRKTTHKTKQQKHA